MVKLKQFHLLKPFRFMKHLPSPLAIGTQNEAARFLFISNTGQLRLWKKKHFFGEKTRHKK
jgi:hypothetical protein